MRFDDILEHIGVFGPYQLRLYLILCLRPFCSALITFSYVFLAGTSDHWCNTPDFDIVNCTQWSLGEEECVEAKKSVAIPLSHTDEYESCIQYNLTGIEPEEWYPEWVTSDVTNDTKACDAGWTYDTSQFKTTIITDFGLVCDNRYLSKVSQSMYFVGITIGSTTIGALSDRFGRYPTMIGAFAIGACSLLITALSNSFAMFVIFRVFIGATFFSANVVTYTLVSEYVGPSWRTFAGNFSNFFWAGGYMVVALFGYFIRSWRKLTFSISGFPLLLLLLLPFVSESPRWLISKGRNKEANRIMRKMALVNKKNVPESFFDGLETEELQDMTTTKVEANTGHQPSVIDLFRYPNLRFKICITLYLWFTTTLVYYGLSQSTGSLGVDFYLSFFISGAIEVPAYMYIWFALDRIGRKPNLSGAYIIGGIACIVSVFLPAGAWRTTIAMIGKFGITIAFAIIFIFTLEQFPTPVRNVSLGISSASGRIGGMLSPLIFILGDWWRPLPYVLFGVLSVIGGLLVLLLPETMGRHLPETITEGEQFGKKSKLPTSIIA